MKNQMIVCLMLSFIPYLLTAQYRPDALEKADETITVFKEKNSKFETYFADAYGYVVFPSVGKGAYVIGGAHGVGTAYELGVPTGKATLTQVTIGLQLGGQAYSQVVFFETENDFLKFKENKFEFAAQASAVVLEEGGSTNLDYREGVAVFTISKGGLMYEAAVGGQKLKFKPYKLEGHGAAIN